MENERESVSLTIHKTSHNRDYTIYNSNRKAFTVHHDLIIKIKKRTIIRS